MPMSLIEENDGVRSIKFVNRQILPNKTTAVEEAIIIDIENNSLSIIEKRFMIDGKPGYYLNDQYIKGEPKLSDKQKMSIVNKVVKKVDSEYAVFEGDPLPVVKKELAQLVMEHRPIKPMELAKKVVESDYNATQEVETIMRDLGIEEDDEIVNVPVSIDRMSRCKLVLDDDRVIELSVDDYLEGVDISREMDGLLMKIKTKRLIVERVHRQNVIELTPLLKYQSLFQQAGLVTVGKVDLVTLGMLAQTECVLQIRERGEQGLLGLIILLHSYDKTGAILPKQYEVGYLLLPRKQHQGYMTEALSAVCDQLNRSQITVTAEVRSDNASSIGVLSRCNFIRITINPGMIELWKRQDMG